MNMPFHISPAPIEAAEWQAVDAAKVAQGAPRSAYRIAYTSRDARFTCGVYECTAGKWRVEYTEDEFCTLIEGRVRLTADDGGSAEFAAPQSFVIPVGFKGFWEPLGNLRKYFVIYEAGVQE